MSVEFRILRMVDQLSGTNSSNLAGAKILSLSAIFLIPLSSSIRMYSLSTSEGSSNGHSSITLTNGFDKSNRRCI